MVRSVVSSRQHSPAELQRIFDRDFPTRRSRQPRGGSPACNRARFEALAARIKRTLEVRADRGFDLRHRLASRCPPRERAEPLGTAIPIDAPSRDVITRTCNFP